MHLSPSGGRTFGPPEPRSTLRTATKATANRFYQLSRATQQGPYSSKGNGSGWAPTVAGGAAKEDRAESTSSRNAKNGGRRFTLCGKEWGASLGKGVCVRIRTEEKSVPSSSFSPFLLAFSRSLFLSLLPHVYVLVFGVHHRALSVTGFGPCAAISLRLGYSMLDYKQKHQPDYATAAVKNSCTSPYTETRSAEVPVPSTDNWYRCVRS